MAESSIFWDGTVGGHATQAPYDVQGFMKFLGKLLFRGGPVTVADYIQGVIWGYGDNLAPLNETPPTVVVGTGMAVIDNMLYINDTPVSFRLVIPASGVNYYKIVLRSNASTQQVRLALLGPSQVSYSDLPETQNPGGIFELVVAKVAINYLGTQTNTNMNCYIHPTGSGLVVAMRRSGGSATNWSAQGVTEYAMYNTFIQVGMARWDGSATSGSGTVTFPTQYSYPPLVFVSCRNEGGESIVVASGNVTSSTFTFFWRDYIPTTRTEVIIAWMAIGPKTGV